MITTTNGLAGPGICAARIARIVAGGLLLLGAGGVQASTILIDFNDLKPAPSFGGIWNVIPDTSGSTALIDDAGAPTNFSLSFFGNWSLDSLQPDNIWTHGNIAWIDADAAEDGLNSSGNDADGVPAIVIAGAGPGTFYQVDFLASQFFGDQTFGEADFYIGSDFGAGSQGNSGDNFNVATMGLDNGEYLTWMNVQAGASGEFRLNIEQDDNLNPPAIGGFASAARITCLEPVYYTQI